MRAGLGAVVGTGRDLTTPSEAAILGVPAEGGGEDPVLTLDTRVLQRSHLSGRYRYRKLNQLPKFHLKIS